MHAKEHIRRCIHIYGQKLIEVLYLTKEELDGDFPQWPLFVLIKAFDGYTSTLKVVDD